MTCLRQQACLVLPFRSSRRGLCLKAAGQVWECCGLQLNGCSDYAKRVAFVAPRNVGTPLLKGAVGPKKKPPMPARLTAISAVFVAGFLLVQPAMGQMPKGSPKYPWDNRPGKCFAPAVEPVGMCSEQPNWPDYPTTVSRVQTLLMLQEMEPLRRSASDLALGNASFPSGQYYFEAWYAALLVQLAYGDNELFTFVEGWRKTDGADSPALLVGAISLVGQAWQARGEGYADSVSPEAWKIFFDKLAQADTLLESASRNIKRSGPWHILKLRVVFDQQSPLAKRYDVLADAIAAWPDSTTLYQIAMSRSSPAWGGSFEMMDGVARVAARSTKSRSAPAMYALVYERAFRGNTKYSLPSTKVDWGLVKQGFRDIEKSGRFPPGIFRNFADLACKMRDRSEAKRLYEISDRQGGGAGDQQGTDPCRAFAFGS
jgi:hypothetical protein